jgi:heat shock protein HtpX
MAAALGLSTYRWNNNLKSILLLLVFPVLLLLLLSILLYLFALVFLSNSAGVMNRPTFRVIGLDSVTGGHGPLDFTLAFALTYWPFVLGTAIVWLFAAYLFNDALIHRATGARAVTRPEAPRLYNLLENLCIARGLGMPRVYVIETEAMNACASGIDQRSYAITVTSGLLARLDDAELEAVLGHELTHIIDRDVRLLLVTILFVGVISFIAQLFWRSLRVVRIRRSGRGIALFLLLSAIVAGIGYLLALVLRFAISREREYLADAGSVELTKRPEALISALRKIAANPAVPHVPSEVRQLFIENPPAVSIIAGLFDAHPPVGARIAVLEKLAGIAPTTVPSADAPPQRPGAPGWISALLLMGSVAYAGLLLAENAADPRFVTAAIDQFAPILDPVANLLPLTLLADSAANPELGLSAALIRHVLPALLLVNVLFGAIALGYSRRQSAYYAQWFTAAPEGAGTLAGIYVVVALIALEPVFLGPMLRVALRWPIEPLGLGGYLFAAASPSLFFHAMRQVVALTGARQRIG